MNRRGFIKSILAAGVAPVFVGSSVLMPVRSILVPTITEVVELNGNRLLTLHEVTIEALMAYQRTVGQVLADRIDSDILDSFSYDDRI